MDSSLADCLICAKAMTSFCQSLCQGVYVQLGRHVQDFGDGPRSWEEHEQHSGDEASLKEAEEHGQCSNDELESIGCEALGQRFDDESGWEPA